MTSLTKVVEIISNHSDDYKRDIFVCEPCQDKHTHTVTPDPETKDGDCEWMDHE